MRKFALLLTILGVGALIAFFGWALYAMRDFGSWTGGSTAIAIAIVIGAVGTGALTGVLMWLAFYSARKGYDDSQRF
jgi:hypothetical protein